MSSVISAALELEKFCSQQNWSYCFIGGLALQRWGELRITVDADLTLIAGWGQEKQFISKLLQAFPSRIKDAADFALQHRVLLLKASNGASLDVALGALEFEERSVERASVFEILSEVFITTCSAEDLVIYKAFANRDRDWADIRGVIQRQGNSLDEKLIFQELEPLVALKEKLNILEKLKELLERFK